MSNIRTRIAPSPTGSLHIGTARTALFNYLFAKKNGGKFILRIEDTDLERSDPKYEKGIFEALAWLGIETDENPLDGGPYAPYRQSERIASYKNYIENLLQKGDAFYCFHSEKELEEEKMKLLEAKRPPLHLCEYRTMNPKEAEALTGIKQDYIIRFKTPADRLIIWRDLIRGELTFESGLIGDFSIAKRVDVPLYNFAVVVDDFEMKITHVIRGEEHISNTPKQLLLIEALGFDKPEYAHLPLILGPDRSKLSKRHGATAVGEYRKEGYLPQALFNFMALLGWNPGDDREILSKDELIQEFSLERVQKSGAIFDVTKLDWMNGEYIRKLSTEELFDRAKDFLPKPYTLYPISYILKVIALEQPRLKKLSEIGERTDYFFRPPEYDKDLLRWKNMTDQEILASLELSEKIVSGFSDKVESPRQSRGKFLRQSRESSTKSGQVSKEEIEKAFLEEIGDGDKGVLLWPLRVALTGKKASPGPFEIMEILGKEETLKRISRAKDIARG